MNLHGQVVLGINELYHDREIFKCLCFAAQDFFALLLDVLLKGFALGSAVSDDAWAVLVAGKLPAFCKLFGRGYLAVFIAELGAAPDIILYRCLHY